MSRFAWLIVAAWPMVVVGQTPAPIPDAAPDTLESIKADRKAAFDSMTEAIQQAGREIQSASKSPRKEDRESGTSAVVMKVKTARAALRARMLGLVDRALALARSRPGESEGLAAASWVAMEATNQTGDDFDERGDAAFRLLADAPTLDDTAIGLAIFAAEGLVLRCPEAEAFLRSVVSRSQSSDLVTIARYELGSYLAEAARTRDRLDAPISGPELAATLTKAHLDRCRAFDAYKLRSEAEALLEQVVREQGNEPRTLGGQAAGELYRIRHLRIGQPAPELVGEDVDGAPIRLGDFRGKVVVLSFWSTRDPQSMSLIAQEKALDAAMRGRPFALVGVNGDAPEDRAKVKETVAREGITWRSFQAGGRDGAIPSKWGVRRWPTTYVIDAEGVIRDDWDGRKLDPAAFQPLVHAAEEKAGENDMGGPS